MKIKSVLFIIVLFAGCAESSFAATAADNIKLPEPSYSFGEIMVYEPLSRTHSPWWILRARKGNKWGYVDSLRGHVMIPFDFDFVDDLINNGFSRHFARALRGKKWGYIGLKGETVIPFVFDHAGQFTRIKGDFLARVSRDNRTFMINTSGMETKPSNWCEVLSDTDVRVENKPRYLLRVKCDGKFGYAVEKERAGQPGKRPHRSPTTRYYNSEKLNMVIPAVYHAADDFATLSVKGKKISLARVQLNGYGFINEKGEAVIPLIYDSLDSFTPMPRASGQYTARAELKKKFGYINEKGETIIPFVYESAGSFHNKKASILKDSVSVQREGKWGFIDYSGRTVIPILYDSNISFQRFQIQGNEMLLATVRRGGKWGVIDSSGRETIPAVYDRISFFQRVEIEGRKTLVAEVTRNGTHGYADHAGRIVIPVEYERVLSFHTPAGCNTSVVAVKRNGKWGFIDATGKIVIPLKYEDVNEFHKRGMHNIARVKIRGKWIYIDDSDRRIRHTVNFGTDSAVGK